MSALNLLRGITHVLITTAPSKERSLSSRIVATADLCFGPEDANCISGIDYVLNDQNQTIWRLPSIEIVVDGKTTRTSVFKGALAEEIGRLAAYSLQRVQKDIGKPKFGKVYRIPTGNASRAEIDSLNTIVGKKEIQKQSREKSAPPKEEEAS